jgi:hypothetical protein
MHLDAIATTTAKHEQLAGERIASQMVANHRRQRIESPFISTGCMQKWICANSGKLSMAVAPIRRQSL